MNPATFLLLNLALAFYNAETIWAHEVDIFRSWKLVGAIALIWYHPDNSPAWVIWCAPGCLIASNVLTGLMWGRWQANLSKDPLGPASPYLAKILSTHWIRTLLINAYAFMLLAWAISSLARQ